MKASSGRHVAVIAGRAIGVSAATAEYRPMAPMIPWSEFACEGIVQIGGKK